MANINSILAGLGIIKKYEGDKTYLFAQHDEIQVGSIHPKNLTDSEARIMDEAGWIWQEEQQSWLIFT